MSKPPVKKVPVDRLRVDGDTQARVSEPRETIKEYAENYAGGGHMPPVVAYDDGESLWLADGHLRLAGAKLAGLAELECEVRAGTLRQARLWAVGCNDRHGLQRTQADKRHAVKMMLTDEEWCTASNNWIAEKCHVSDGLVASVRAEGTENRGQSGQEVASVADGGNNARPISDGKRMGKDGKRRPASIKVKLCDACRRLGATANCPQCEELRTAPARAREVKERIKQEKEAARAKEKADWEAAKRPKVGDPKFDWHEYDKHFGPVSRAPDVIAATYDGEKEGLEYLAAMRCLRTLEKIMARWRRRLLKLGEKAKGTYKIFGERKEQGPRP